MPKIQSRLGRGLGSLISGDLTADAAPQKKPSAPQARRAAAPKKRAKKKQAKPTKKTPPPAAAKPKPTPQAKPSLPDFVEIDLKAIEPNPYQPRKDYDLQQVEELAESIRAEGLLQAIVVRPEGKKFQLIAGERRWRACQQLKLPKIPARVIEASDSSSAVMALVENLQREALNPLDEALGYASLMADFDLTQEMVAQRIGKARASIANALRLLQLDEDIQGYLKKNLLSVGHAKVLLGVSDAAQRKIVARRAVEEKLSVRELERSLTKNSFGKGTGQPLAPLRDTQPTDSHNLALRDLEKRLTSKIGTRVQIRHNSKRGQLVIDYHGNEDLQRLLELFGLD